MKGIQFILQRKILIGLVTTLILILGSYAMIHMDEELMPPLSMDGGYINIEAAEQPAVEVERTITTPLERQIESIEGIKEVRSTSSDGRTSLQLAFERGKGDEAIKEVESLTNQLTSTLNVDRVEVGQYGTTQNYQFFLDLSGGDMEKMSEFATNTLEPRLEELPEVRDVDIIGIQNNEMVVQFDREKLQENGLQIDQVLPILQQIDEEATLGELSGEAGDLPLRWDLSIDNTSDLENLSIPTQSGPISLQDIATITLQPQEQSSYVWKNGAKEFLFAQVGGSANFTDIETAGAVREEIKAMEDEGLFDGFNLNEVVAQADYVEDSINGVTSNILIGGLIAIAILLIFLRNLRATFIISISIPTSILLTLTSMWMFDYSLNMLTLIGLGLGIGMMVDSSIVILESIYNKKENGLIGMEAVTSGIKEVATAVIASMLTTIVVFLPIGLLGGEMGQFMIILSIVVAITLISSVAISFTLIPSLAVNFLKLTKNKQRRKNGPILNFYERLVSWIVRKKRYSLSILVLFVAMFAGSLLLVTKIPMTIMPDVFNRYAELMIDVEEGLSQEDKQEIVRAVHDELNKIDDVDSNYVMDNGGMMYTIINMTKGDKITTEQKEVNEQIFKSLRSLEEEHPINNVASVMEAGGSSPVQVNIKGESFEQLQDLAKSFKAELEKIDGIVASQTSIDHTIEEQIIVLDQKALNEAGINQMQVRQIIEQSFLNQPIGELHIDQQDVPFLVTWDNPTDSKEAFFDIDVPTASGNEKLSSFVSLETVDTPNEINHVDGERYISVTADIEGRDLGSINRDVQKVVEDFKIPSGYDVTTAGDLEAQQQVIQEMLLILGIAIFLVYLVMAVQFNHLFHPLIVMSVIPMTVVGVILGLFLTQRELSVMSAMGIIMLIGIVLNNAILFITRTNQLRTNGMAVEEALIQSGKDRIRPIFMTSLTTAGGMLPLALASGSAGNYQAPMATVIISGLLFATFITLLLIPAIYRLFSRTKKKQKTKIESPVGETAM
ncbi:hydrophobic/amphiphilic exporter-1, HAE1 family [Halobacillus dabanensis]|uniref:Hydrophobic/amphiphilic exporter-1, HAE1 family n=1 Tax=Halobacillus dabanensis TaxID=240302 RepID=A0A1I3TVS2_HALDA|nr:efflux RND transporter permease subunit [Halobacillus dabanensis]SFJ74583.1 hydrophobic/amphiphilic exporter-1, HAE1 family [Halobacillus dabanensis]